MTCETYGLPPSPEEEEDIRRFAIKWWVFMLIMFFLSWLFS